MGNSSLRIQFFNLKDENLLTASQRLDIFLAKIGMELFTQMARVIG